MQLAHQVLKAIQETEHNWIVELLYAFNSGKIKIIHVQNYVIQGRPACISKSLCPCTYCYDNILRVSHSSVLGNLAKFESLRPQWEKQVKISLLFDLSTQEAASDFHSLFKCEAIIIRIYILSVTG